MFIIQSGRVRISKRFADRDHTLTVLEKGDFFGEMAIVNRVRRTASAVALEEVELLAVDRDGLLAMIRKNAKIALNLIDKLCRRLHNTTLYVADLARHNGAGLAARHLLNAFKEGGPDLELAGSVREISYALEIPADTVASFIEGFTTSGAVSIRDGRVLLLDSGKLEALATETAASQ